MAGLAYYALSARGEKKDEDKLEEVKEQEPKHDTPG